LVEALGEGRCTWGGAQNVGELVAAGLRLSRPGDAGAVLDARAIATYRARLVVLREELEEAEGTGDSERAVRVREEMAALAGQLSAAVGLGGRTRKAAAATERARINVRRAIKQSIDRIAATCASLGWHLSTSVRTGTFCSYWPAPAEDGKWEIS
jgi:hypothetical protein